MQPLPVRSLQMRAWEVEDSDSAAVHQVRSAPAGSGPAARMVQAGQERLVQVQVASQAVQVLALAQVPLLAHFEAVPQA